MRRCSTSLMLAILLGASLLVGEAQAAGPLPDSGLVEILPVAEVLGDGETAVEVRVVALEPTGLPMPGLKLKVDASAGTVAGWREVSAGIYAFDFTPPSVERDTKVKVHVSGRSVTRGNVATAYEIPVRPPPAGEITATPKPNRLVLGKSDGGTLLIDSKEPVLIRASSGDIENLTDMGAKKTARYVPPRVNFPHVGLITLADASDPGQGVGYTAFMLDGSVDYPVDVSPNAKVMLKVADGDFGPVDASPEGKAAVPIVVPPGVQKATVISVVDGETTEEEIDLRIPETRRISLFPLPKVIPADSGVGVKVRAVVVTPEGEPDAAAKPVFSATSGEVSAATHEGDGIYVATWTPGDGDEGGKATVSVKLGASKVQEDTIEVITTPRRVTRLSVVEPESAPAEGPVSVVIRAEGSGGPISGLTLQATASGAEIEGTTEKGDGLYQIDLVRAAGEPLDLDVLVPPVITDNPLRHVVLVPGTDLVVNGSGSANTITVATVDAFGYPVPGIDVALTVESGDGALSARSVTTDLHGIAQVEYQAGEEPTLVRLRGTAGEATGAASFLQVPQGTAPLDLTVGGSDAVRRITDAWDHAALQWSGGEGVAVAAAAPKVELAPEGAPVKALELAVEPQAVRPGGVALLEITPRAEDGLAIPGASLDLLTSAGTFGPLTEEQGTYTTELSVPADAEGTIKLSAIAESGVMELIEITVDPNAPEPILAKRAEPAAAKPKPERIKPPKQPKEPGERPWLRAGLSGVGSVYRYEQSPSAEPGPLLPHALAVGSGGSSPAIPLGAELDVRGWLEDVPYFGFHGLLRISSYAINTPIFQEPAPDTLYNVQLEAAGRYPFALGGDQFWVGGKAGFHYNDFIHFTGCLEAACDVEWAPLPLWGLGLGAELGAEVADLFFIAGYTHGLAYFSVPYASYVDVDLGYQLHQNGYVSLGFSTAVRKVALNGKDSGLERGTLADQQLIFTLGGGVSF